ncbi:universal stress protein [Salinigranum halophilum]|jgi:nucleotide-binding universal stress UspA family protein|uniref:universal stress protein n=1 Tax=Salinigranum halophilum TaxID=2565931 RepID=UPI0010A94789|nr:universal stress protein [Salinigranum halophilum]
MTFLVAVDGSEASKHALAHATDLAERLGESLLVVQAVEPAVVDVGGDEPDGFDDTAGRLVAKAVEDAEADAERVLEAARDHAANAGVEVETELLYGSPLQVIPDVTERADVEGLFVGHRGLSGRYEGLVGSVAKGLVERSHVPVTVVR